MQIDRLLEIILVLQRKKQVTAGELARRFGVSTRTIYRDVDALSLAGVPVYSTKGNGGGIGLLPEYTLDKSLLSERERRDIVFALQGLSAARFPDMESTLGKISALFQQRTQAANWVEVDFSHWGSSETEKDKFHLLREAIFEKRVVTFQYTSTHGQATSRRVEPVRMLFKGRAWYLQAFCQTRQAWRLFRISRIQSPGLADEVFHREPPAEDAPQGTPSTPPAPVVSLRLKFAPEAEYRLYDDFNSNEIERGEEGCFLVTVEYLFDEWVIGYILSFGSLVEVLEPAPVREIIRARAAAILQKYS